MTDKDLESFENYYYNRFNPAEKLAFRNRLESEPELLEAYYDYQLLIKSMKLPSNERFTKDMLRRQKTPAIEQPLPAEPVAEVIPSLSQSAKTKAKVVQLNISHRVLGIAAAISLLVFSFFLVRTYFNTEQAVIAKEQINDYHQELLAIDNMMAIKIFEDNSVDGGGKTDEVTDRLIDFRESTTNYDPADEMLPDRREQINTSIQNISETIKNRPNSKLQNELYYLRAQLYHLIRDYGNALADFASVDAAVDSQLYNQKHFSQGLIHLKLRDEIKALKEMEAVMNSRDTTLQKSSQQLANQINQMNNEN